MQTTITSKLMKNHVAGKALPAQQALAVTYTADNAPMLLSLDAASAFRVTVPSLTSTTGWEQVDLGSQLSGIPSLGATPVVQCFAVSQDADGALWLVIAAAPAPKAASQVFLSAKMPNTGASSDWTGFAGKLTPRPLPAGLVCTQFTLGTADDTGAPPLIVAAATDSSGMVMHYQINPDPADTTWTSTPLILPQNATRCLAAAVGSTPGLGRGVYALCELGPGVSLTFTTLPQFFDGHPVTQSIELQLPAGLNPTTLATLPVETGHTEVYVAGDGLYRYPLSSQTESNLPGLAVADASQFGGVGQLVVTRDPAGIEVYVWATNRSDQLVLAVGTHDGSDYVWQTPVLVAAEITALATCRTYDAGTTVSLASLVIGRTDGSLSLLTQDSATTLWRSQSVSVKTTDTALELSTYTLRIMVADDDGIPLQNQAIDLRPSFDCPVLVNGEYFALKSSAAKTVTTGADGTLTLVLETPDLTAPSFTITAGQALQTSTDPGADVAAQLRGITSGAQIANAVRSDGKPLFPSGADLAQCNSAATALGELMKAHDSLPDTPPASQSRQLCVRAAAAGGPLAAPRARVSCRGFRFEPGGGVAVLEHDAAVAALTPRGIEEFWVAAGDLFAALASGLEPIGQFFINQLTDAWEFVVDLGSRVLHFIFEVAAQAIAAVKWVFKEVLGIDLDQLIAWLGFVFDWSDILDNHKVIVKTINLGFQKTIADIQTTQTTLVQAFETVRSRLINDHLIVDQSNAIFTQRARHNPGQESELDSPQANWGSQQLQVNSGSITQTDTSIGDIEDLFSRLTDTEVQIITNAISQFQTQIIDNFDQMSFGQILGEFLEIVGAALINTAENVALTVLEAVEILVAAIQALLNTRWNIPVITYVYEEIICQGDGSRLTLLDVIGLLAAIPATILYKAAAGQNLFSPTETERVLAAQHWDDFMAVFPATAPAVLHARVGAMATANATRTVSAAERAAIAFQCISAGCRFVTAILAPVADFEEDKLTKDKITRVKVGFDWAVYICSVVNFSLVTAVRQGEGASTTSPRYVIDGTVTTSQLLLRIKDTFLVIWKYKKGEDSALKNGLSYVESVFGVGIAIAVCVSIGFEANEDPPEDVNVNDWKYLFSMKFIQNFCGGCYSGFAFMPNLSDPKAKLAGIVIRAALGGIRAATSIGRAVTETTLLVADIDD